MLKSVDCPTLKITMVNKASKEELLFSLWKKKTETTTEDIIKHLDKEGARYCVVLIVYGLMVFFLSLCWLSIATMGGNFDQYCY